MQTRLCLTRIIHDIIEARRASFEVAVFASLGTTIKPGVGSTIVRNWPKAVFTVLQPLPANSEESWPRPRGRGRSSHEDAQTAQLQNLRFRLRSDTRSSFFPDLSSIIESDALLKYAGRDSNPQPTVPKTR